MACFYYEERHLIPSDLTTFVTYIDPQGESFSSREEQMRFYIRRKLYDEKYLEGREKINVTFSTFYHYAPCGQEILDIFHEVLLDEMLKIPGWHLSHYEKEMWPSVSGYRFVWKSEQ